MTGRHEDTYAARQVHIFTYKPRPQKMPHRTKCRTHVLYGAIILTYSIGIGCALMVSSPLEPGGGGGVAQECLSRRLPQWFSNRRCRLHRAVAKRNVHALAVTMKGSRGETFKEARREGGNKSSGKEWRFVA